MGKREVKVPAWWDERIQSHNLLSSIGTHNRIGCGVEETDLGTQSAKETSKNTCNGNVHCGKP